MFINLCRVRPTPSQGNAEGRGSTAYGDSGNDIFRITKDGGATIGDYENNDTIILEVIGENQFSIRLSREGHKLMMTIDPHSGADSKVFFAAPTTRADDYLTAISSPNLTGKIRDDIRAKIQEFLAKGEINLRGTQSADTIFGLGGDDRLYGEGGNDILYGGQGSDGLFGGAGSDILYGGAGKDIFTGGDGADIFVAELKYDVDNILDFNRDQGDKIRVDLSQRIDGKTSVPTTKKEFYDAFNLYENLYIRGTPGNTASYADLVNRNDPSNNADDEGVLSVMNLQSFQYSDFQFWLDGEIVTPDIV